MIPLSGPVYLIFEYCCYGDLLNYLRSKREKFHRTWTEIFKEHNFSFYPTFQSHPNSRWVTAAPLIPVCRLSKPAMAHRCHWAGSQDVRRCAGPGSQGWPWSPGRVDCPSPTALLLTVSAICGQLWSRSNEWNIPEQTGLKRFIEQCIVIIVLD